MATFAVGPLTSDCLSSAEHAAIPCARLLQEKEWREGPAAAALPILSR